MKWDTLNVKDVHIPRAFVYLKTVWKIGSWLSWREVNVLCVTSPWGTKLKSTINKKGVWRPGKDHPIMEGRKWWAIGRDNILVTKPLKRYMVIPWGQIMWRGLERWLSVLLGRFILGGNWHCRILISPIQLNLSSRATLGTEESGRYREAKSRLESMDCLPRKLAVEERWSLWRGGRQWRFDCKK